jgi:hypothetical protein
MASPTPAPATRTKRNQSDPYSDWALDTIAHLTNKLNNEIQIKKNGNTLKLSNISDTDLQNLKFITITDQSKRHLKMTNCGVSIKESTGTPMALQIPGLSQMVSQMFIDSASESFFANEKTFKPFKQAAAKAVPSQSNVGDIVDKMTAMMPSMPKTVGKDKTYHLSFISSNASPPGGHGGCPPGYFTLTPGGTCIHICPPGYAQSPGGFCIRPCPPGYAPTPGGSCIRSCPLGYTRTASGGCIASCPRGYTQDGDCMSPCPLGSHPTLTDSGKEICVHIY